MSQKLNPDRALIFRITHVRNADALMSRGCESRSRASRTTRYAEIGNQELIEKRNVRNVPCGPGGTLSDYVPFYFTPYTPMLMNIKTGYGVPRQPMPDIIILISSLHHLRELGVPFVFSDRHAYLKTARFSDDLNDLNWIIWETLRARNFRKDDVDRFEKYQAEALVYNHVPLNALLGIVCNNDEAKMTMQTKADANGASVKIVSQPSWYL